MNKIAVISNAVPLITEKFTDLGFKLIYTDAVDEFISYEQKHADMQCLVVDDKVFVLSLCDNLFNKLKKLGYKVIKTQNKYSGTYPNNILLNAKIVGKYLIGKIKNLDTGLLEYCKNHNYIPINVKQGYSACSMLKVTDNAIITADNSIYKTLKYTDIDVLKISEGNIRLYGAEEDTYGFIGGASAKIDNNTVVFFGDIRKHPDYLSIVKFCSEREVNIEYIKDMQLIDIGSGILLNY